MQTKSILNHAKRASASFPPVPNCETIISVSVRPTASDKHENCGGWGHKVRLRHGPLARFISRSSLFGAFRTEFRAPICALCALDLPLHSARSDPISNVVLRSVYLHRISSQRCTFHYFYPSSGKRRHVCAYTQSHGRCCVLECAALALDGRAALLSAALAAGANAENVWFGASGWPSFASAAVHCLFCALERPFQPHATVWRDACTCTPRRNAAIGRNKLPAPVHRTAHFETINRRLPLFPSKFITYSAASEPSCQRPIRVLCCCRAPPPETMATVIALIIAHFNPLKRPHSPRQTEAIREPFAS